MDKESSIYKKVKKEADNKFSSKTGIYNQLGLLKNIKKEEEFLKQKNQLPNKMVY